MTSIFTDESTALVEHPRRDPGLPDVAQFGADLAEPDRLAATSGSQYAPQLVTPALQRFDAPAADLGHVEQSFQGFLLGSVGWLTEDLGEPQADERTGPTLASVNSAAITGVAVDPGPSLRWPLWSIGAPHRAH
ncbi:hypothetical protein AB0346_00100 [Nocardia beijingensis]|uniref:hypothetical protein n=1 Tax=Nocardia beijingensis TaxID=95162 RepID=UPI00344D0407